MNNNRKISFKEAEKLFEARKTVFHTTNFIYFIAFYTALNSFLSLIDQTKFIGLALNICTIIDELIDNAPLTMIIIGLLINLVIVSFFIYLAIQVKKKELWAYSVAIIIYIIDTTLIFVAPFDYKIANFILHLFVIWMIWSEYKEFRDYFKLEKSLYLPKWALSDQSSVIFIQSSDLDLQTDEASQLILYKKAIAYQERNKPINAIENFTEAIRIWELIPSSLNKDKDWFALALLNKAILLEKVRSKSYNEIFKCYVLAYYNFKLVLKEDVVPVEKNHYTNKILHYSNYNYVNEHFTKCVYHLLTFLKNNQFDDRENLSFAGSILEIEVDRTKYLMNEVFNDAFDILESYQMNVWENLWTLKTLEEVTIRLDYSYHEPTPFL